MLTGGEPTLHPKSLDFFTEHLSGITEDFIVVTNGLKLSSESYAEQLIANPLIKEIAISLHGGKPASHHAMVMPIGMDPGGLFYRIINAFASVNKARYRLDRPELTISINLNVNAYADLIVMVNTIEEAGGKIDKVTLQTINPAAGRAPEALKHGHPAMRLSAPTESMISAYFSQAERLIQNRRIHEFTVEDPLPGSIVSALGLTSHQSYQPASIPAINVDGVFRPNVIG